MAAKALRAARASPDPWRQTCFGVAAFYKRLALDDEILKGERQRSGARVVKTMPPRDPNDDDDCAEDESQLDEISGRARSGRRRLTRSYDLSTGNRSFEEVVSR